MGTGGKAIFIAVAMTFSQVATITIHARGVGFSGRRKVYK
jgi:hypothetical protein